MRGGWAGWALCACCWAHAARAETAAEPWTAVPPGEPLVADGDFADRLIAGVDRFLDRQLAAAPAEAAQFWDAGGDPQRRDALRREHRARLRHILGLRDERPRPASLQLAATVEQPALAGQSGSVRILRVRWAALDDVFAEGLLLEPEVRRVAGGVVLVPDADQTPEELAGLVPGTSPENAWGLRLAHGGVRVLVPALVSRAVAQRGRSKLSHREFLYRSAFELGRHLIGYELQEIFAGLDGLEEAALREDPQANVVLGAAGWGEGGLLAYFAAAVDERIDAACVSGAFDDRRQVWRQPIDRNVFGLLERFGDAELSLLVHPRPLVVEACRGPEATLAGEGGAPAELRSPELAAVRGEAARARDLSRRFLDDDARLTLVESGAEGQGPPWTEAALSAWTAALGVAVPEGAPPAEPVDDATRRASAAEARLQRKIDALDRFNQRLLETCADDRDRRMAAVDYASPEAYLRSIEPLRTFFRDEVIGDFELPLAAARPRLRQAYDEPGWIGYEAVLDVFDEVFVYGILCVPRDLAPGERRPAIVCQHGLEGRPQDVVQGDHPAYHDFAARLAERGFVTFAPQHLYLFGDRFRTLQRKSNPLKKTLFSVMVPQHRQIVRWLGGLPFVDGRRIGFYGLSYGGKSAMRIPPLVPEYAAVACSADFNDWVWKNASTHSPYSYVWKGEYEIFEFDLGTTFNYAEMAALIAPRPFIVERGHFDGVAPDERVAYEFAKVRMLYAGRLKLPDRCAIEFFDGPHTINGRETFAFFHRTLGWPAP